LFCCGTECIFDPKHPDRNKFIEVRTISSNIHKLTLTICKACDDEATKTVENRVINVHDLVAAEARYHIMYRRSFENPLPEYKTPGRPVSSNKTVLFEKACEVLENDMELYSVTEFHTLMSKFGEDIYTVKMTKTKLHQKYKDSIQLVTRNGKSDIILLNTTAEILGTKWYNDRKSNLQDQSERIIKTAAALIKSAIKNHELETKTYPSNDDIKTGDNHRFQIF